MLSFDKIGLNFKFERAFALVLENISGPSAVTHYHRNITTNYHHFLQQCLEAEWSKAHRLKRVETVQVRRFEPRDDRLISLCESN